MKLKTFRLISQFDSLSLGLMTLIPDVRPVGILQFSHGMTERKERYLEIMKRFAEKGYVCIINDHRGHGESVKSENDFGYFYENGARAVVEDLRQITLYIKKEFPDLPCFMIAHSMGTMVARSYIKKYDSEIDGLILCGAPSWNDAVTLLRPVAENYAKYGDDHMRDSRLNDMFINVFNYSFKGENNLNAWLCSDKEVVRAFTEDEKCGFPFTLNGYLCLLDLMNDIYQDKNAAAGNPDLPIVFLAGEEDACVGSKKRLLGSVNRLQETGYRWVGYKIYPKMRHEIMNEKGKERVFEDMFGILEVFRFVAGEQ